MLHNSLKSMCCTRIIFLPGSTVGTYEFRFLFVDIVGCRSVLCYYNNMMMMMIASVSSIDSVIVEIWKQIDKLWTLILVFTYFIQTFVPILVRKLYTYLMFTNIVFDLFVFDFSLVLWTHIHEKIYREFIIIQIVLLSR